MKNKNNNKELKRFLSHIFFFFFLKKYNFIENI